MNDLGHVLAEHRGRLAAGGIAWYVGGIMFVCSLVGAFKAVAAGDLATVGYFMIMLPLLGLWHFYNYARWRQRITIHEHGFVWTRVVRKPVVVRWDDIERADVTSTSGRRTLHTKGVHVVVELYLRGGKRVTVTNDIQGVEVLASYAGAPKPAAAVPSPWGAEVRV